MLLQPPRPAFALSEPRQHRDGRRHAARCLLLYGSGSSGRALDRKRAERRPIPDEEASPRKPDGPRSGCRTRGTPQPTRTRWQSVPSSRPPSVRTNSTLPARASEALASRRSGSPSRVGPSYRVLPLVASDGHLPYFFMGTIGETMPRPSGSCSCRYTVPLVDRVKVGRAPNLGKRELSKSWMGREKEMGSCQWAVGSGQSTLAPLELDDLPLRKGRRLGECGTLTRSSQGGESEFRVRRGNWHA
jgi:hypothetical protein